MANKSTFVLRALGARKRVLLVVSKLRDCQQRSEFLRRNGYEVDCASSMSSAVTMNRVNSYDIIVLPIDLDCDSLMKLGRKLQRDNPNATIACLADCKKPLPSPLLPAHCLLWKGEPLEYFVARMDALATTA